MDDETGEDWVNELSDGFDRLAVQDRETGEVWYPERENVTLEFPDASRGHCQPSSRAPSRLANRFRVPKQYSKLGSNYSDEESDSVNATKFKVVSDLASCKLPPKTKCDSGVIVDSVPCVGKLPSFCRKRRSSTALEEPEKSQSMSTRVKCRLERFLEEREGLFMVGRILLVAFVLLSPGFVLPLIFTLKLFCHFQVHCHNEHECPTEMFPLIYGKQKYSIIPARTLLMYQCRLCRDERVSQKILRLHSHLNPARQKCAATSN